MAHPNQVEFCTFITKLKPTTQTDVISYKNKSVLDVGSIDINGNNRYLFEDCDYTGLDIGEGKNVDVICPIENYNPEKQFDIIISTEMLEHCRNWKMSLLKMYELLKDRGVLILTAGGDGRGEHGTHNHDECASPYTLDYYGNISNEMFQSVLKPSMFQDYYCRQDKGDFQFYGIKK